MTAILPYLTQRAAYARNVVNGTNGQIAPIPPVTFTRTSPSPTSGEHAFRDGLRRRLDQHRGDPPAGQSRSRSRHLDRRQLLDAAAPDHRRARTPTLSSRTITPGPSSAQQRVTITGTGSIFPAGPGSLVVSELHYNPPGSTDATEFIELLNVTGATLDLSGCHFDEEDGQGISLYVSRRSAGGRRRPDHHSAQSQRVPGGLRRRLGAQLVSNQFDPSALDNSGECSSFMPPVGWRSSGSVTPIRSRVRTGMAAPSCVSSRGQTRTRIATSGVQVPRPGGTRAGPTLSPSAGTDSRTPIRTASRRCSSIASARATVSSRHLRSISSEIHSAVGCSRFRGRRMPTMPCSGSRLSVRWVSPGYRQV